MKECEQNLFLLIIRFSGELCEYSKELSGFIKRYVNLLPAL
jgi:hypothetical protein